MLIKIIILIVSTVSLLALANEGGANLNLFAAPKADSNKAKQPSKPELKAPAYQAKITTENVNLKWSAVTSADAYHLQIATDPAFKWLVTNQEVLKETSFELTGLKKGTHYFWRVAAVKSDNEPTYTKSWFSTSAFQTP